MKQKARELWLKHSVCPDSIYSGEMRLGYSSIITHLLYIRSPTLVIKNHYDINTPTHNLLHIFKLIFTEPNRCHRG